ESAAKESAEKSGKAEKVEKPEKAEENKTQSKKEPAKTQAPASGSGSVKSDQRRRTSPLHSRQEESRRNRGNAPLSRHQQRIEDLPPNQRKIGSTLASLEEAARQAALAEMKAAPLITEMPKDRIVDLNAPSRKKSREESGEKSGKPQHEQKGHAAVHLAPLPTAAPVKAPKAAKEPAPQKPAARFDSPEELRAAMEKGVTPLSSHIKAGRDKREKREGAPAKSAPSQNRIIDFNPEKDAAKRDRDSKGRKKYDQTEVFMSGEEDSTPKKGTGKKTKLRPESDTSENRRRGGKSLFTDEDSAGEYRPVVRTPRASKNKGLVSTVPRKGDCVIEMPCTVKQFAESTGLSVASIIKKMMEFGRLLTINQSLDQETVELLIEAFELKAVVKKERSLEELFVDTAFDQEDPPETLKPRPPVVTFLGHVDHGKTSLLDRIMHMNVVSGEKGGITQHIRTYRVKKEKGDITFVDTPGHEAFTEMRARGANCTDIAVLVVAADDGVMPQTEEAISHIKAAGVPIVVALNKMDLPGANREKVISELANADVMPSEWGGDVEVVETSATTGKGIDELLDTLLMIAELKELKANPNRPANGVALEAAMLPGRGVVCKILVQTGTLRPGDIVLCGTAYGKVKALFDPLDEKKHLKLAGPSTPVNLLGLNSVPGAGSKFVVLDDISVARQIAAEREQLVHANELADDQSHITLENLFDRINSAKTQQTLNIIIRADVRGSIEAIRKEISKLEHPEVKVKILQASVGGITEADVHLANASDAIIVGFNVVPDEGARALAESKKVQIRRYEIIYKMSEDIRAAMEGMLKPLEQVKELGRALVKQVFSISRIGTIAGCRVISGSIERDCRVRVIRDSRIIGEYILDTLKREKDDAKEVREGYECGIKLRNFNDIKEGDVLEGYKIEEIARTL
ncbi:MAG: translation initiation factor IF-2, partial [Planctomycetia bacterium]|nr:translation initiation factor IF-2 [Planctomycetia bacterium]